LDGVVLFPMAFTERVGQCYFWRDLVHLGWALFVGPEIYRRGILMYFLLEVNPGVVNSIFLYIVGMYVAKVLFNMNLTHFLTYLLGVVMSTVTSQLTVPSLTEGISTSIWTCVGIFRYIMRCQHMERIDRAGVGVYRCRSRRGGRQRISCPSRALESFGAAADYDPVTLVVGEIDTCRRGYHL